MERVDGSVSARDPLTYHYSLVFQLRGVY